MRPGLLRAHFLWPHAATTNLVPGQPDFIAVGLEAPYTVRMGDSFELSVPEESGAEDYFWSLPEMLNVIEGENTSRLLVAGLVSSVKKDPH